MAFKIVISNKEKTIQKEIKDEQARALLGLKIGDVFDGRLVGESHRLRITGGSDKEGFPMRKDIEGTRRLLLLLEWGPGYRPSKKGERKKKRVRGNTVSEALVQVNTVVVEEKKEEQRKEEPKKGEPVKEKPIREPQKIAKEEAKPEIEEPEEKAVPEESKEEAEQKGESTEEKPKKKKAPAKKKIGEKKTTKKTVKKK